jgi:glycosyltransferase involved in cell wall biosynthesis
MRPRICLNMIVRDEAAVIERCLASVRPFIDAWVVVDTGSKDATPELVKQALAGIPGELHKRPWRNFGHNRTEALQLARGAADYLLFIDADETLEAPGAFSWPVLEAPAYHLYADYKGTRYSRPALIDTRLDWRWEGVLHEFPVATPPVGFVQLDWPRIVVRQDGARSRDPRKLHKDIEVLREAIGREPQNARHVFYLAQTYRDVGELERARETYWQRSRMQGWHEEAWYSIYQVARMTERLAASTPEVQAAYLYAFHQRPTRAEPLFHLGRYHNERGEHALAYVFARPAAEMGPPPDSLFVEEEVYRWRALDEMSLAAAACGARAAAQWAMERLLREGHLPSTEVARVRANLARLR